MCFRPRASCSCARTTGLADVGKGHQQTRAYNVDHINTAQIDADVARGVCALESSSLSLFCCIAYMGVSWPSLLIESTDSMITQAITGSEQPEWLPQPSSLRSICLFSGIPDIDLNVCCYSYIMCSKKFLLVQTFVGSFLPTLQKKFTFLACTPVRPHPPLVFKRCS